MATAAADSDGDHFCDDDNKGDNDGDVGTSHHPGMY